MVNLGAVIDFFLVLLLAGIGGLLVILHVRLRAFLSMQKQMPVLGEALSTSLIQARSTLAQLSSALQNQGPALESHLKRAENTLQDLDFVLHRADKVLGGLDSRLERARVLEEKEKHFSFEPKAFLADPVPNTGGKGEGAPVFHKEPKEPVEMRPSASVTPLRARVEQQSQPDIRRARFSEREIEQLITAQQAAISARENGGRSGPSLVAQPHAQGESLQETQQEMPATFKPFSPVRGRQSGVRPSVEVHQKLVAAQQKAGRRLPSDAEEKLRNALRQALAEQG